MKRILFDTAGKVQMEVFELEGKLRLIKFKKGDEEFSFKAEYFKFFDKKNEEISKGVDIPSELPRKHKNIINEFFSSLSEKKISVATKNIKMLINKAAEQEKLIKSDLQKGIDCGFNQVSNILDTYINIQSLLIELLDDQLAKQSLNVNKDKEQHFIDCIECLDESLSVIIKKTSHYYHKLNEIKEEQNALVFKYFTKGKTVH